MQSNDAHSTDHGGDLSAFEARTLERARRARDPRFDGTFFVGVRSTGIYCRPVCPAPLAKRENVRYFATAAAAVASGLRPCLRCRPEAAVGTPAWRGTSATVSRALRLIDDGALDGDGSVETLATRLGVGPRHLRRLFERHLGASPLAVARTRRLHFARRLLKESDLRIVDVAFASGFSSLRSFNRAFQETYGVAPSRLRDGRPVRGPATGAAEFSLPYREPYPWRRILAYLRPRVFPGVEEVTDDHYRRRLEWRGRRLEIEVSHRPEASSLWLRVQSSTSESASVRDLLQLVARVRRMFDLDAVPTEIESGLTEDPRLAAAWALCPGVRVPVGWSPFEVAVRAVLGQQVSVAAAATLAGRLIERWGERAPACAPEDARGRGLDSLFPSPTRLRSARFEEIGMPGSRATALRALAAAFADDPQLESAVLRPEEVHERLVELPGVGPWTADYVVLRGLGYPDVFPAGDLALRKALSEDSSPVPAKRAAARAESWRPWRSYAALLLWQTGADGAKTSGSTRHSKA